ncbi:MAG TPA: MFS transporter [Vicinamibacterales bacterium]|nr:MFS transporter [Vicinamibacterales bacterium]
MSLRQSRALVVALVTAACFTDIVAYSIAVPVLPDLSRRLGASPAVIGLLFGSFGVTMLVVSLPMGAISDRIGRKGPMLAGLVALAASTLLFAYATALPALFAARLVQGAADAVAWVVGFALVADLYAPEERGRVTGIILGGSSFAYMIGPSLGGWLYEMGGIRLPFLFVTGMAVLTIAGFVWLRVPEHRAPHEELPVGRLLRHPAVLTCAVVVFIAASSLTMFEPVFVLYLQATLGIGPAKVGTVFAAASLANVFFHPLVGRAVDKWGARRLTGIGLLGYSVMLPIVSNTWSYPSAIVLSVLIAATFAMIATPSLTFMADATTAAGIGSFGTAYGLYNAVWAVGVLFGPALGGYLYERMRFSTLALGWSAAIVLVTLSLPVFRSVPIARPSPASPTGAKS